MPEATHPQKVETLVRSSTDSPVLALSRHCAHNLLAVSALSWIAGAFFTWEVNDTLPHRTAVLLVIPALLALILVAAQLWRRFRPLAVIPFFFLVGLFQVFLALHPLDDPTRIEHHVTAKTKATVVGTILTMPEWNGDTSRLLVECESLLVAVHDQPMSFQSVRGKVLLTVGNRLPPHFQAGRRIMASAVMDRIHSYRTPGAFDYRLQMATKEIACSGWVSSSAAMEIVTEAPDPPFMNTLLHDLRFAPEQMRQHIADFVDKTLEPEAAGLYKALLIGSLVNIPPETLEGFKASGCFHLLAISGLHFSLLGLFSLAVMRVVLKQSQWLLLHTHVPTLALLLTAPILLLYAFIAGMNLPALRALIMALLVLVAVLSRRQRSFLPLIAAAALLILVTNPLALFTASFQLSFAAVLAINLLYPRLPHLQEQAENQSPWRHLVGRGWRIGQSMLLVSLAATAGTLPILLYHFNRVSLVGPIMNLLIEPLLCLWALPAGLIAFALLWWAPDLAAISLHCGAVGMETALWLINALQSLPFLSLWTITPSWLEIGLYLLIIWLLISRPAPLPGHLPLASALALLLAGLFTSGLWTPPSREDASVHFLDVGQGTSTLLLLPGGKTILIDGGGHQSNRFDIGESLIAPYLWHLRLWQLDDVIITHPHGDHYNGLLFIFKHFRPQRLIVNGDEGEETAYRDLLAAVRQIDVPIHTATTGTVLYKNNGVEVKSLGMSGFPEVDQGSVNDRSLVVMLKNGEHTFLFPGDIGAPSERILLDSAQELRSEVLLAPHHGSRGSVTPEFIRAVDPGLIMVSSGRQRQGVLPAPDHLRQWHEQKILTLLTSQHGTTTCTSNGKQLHLKSFNGTCAIWNGKRRKFEETKCTLKGGKKHSMLSDP
jgi:competence protein ComEC